MMLIRAPQYTEACRLKFEIGHGLHYVEHRTYDCITTLANAGAISRRTLLPQVER